MDVSFHARFIAVLVVAACSAINSAAAEPAASDLPAEWLQAWRSPGVEFRPLQIVHGVRAQQATPEAMKRLKDLGLGGIVCNVAFDSYLRSEANWQTWVEAVKACAQVGLRVWIYDEEGYPSGAAGGLVLKENPGFEALALAYDPVACGPVYRPGLLRAHARLQQFPRGAALPQPHRQGGGRELHTGDSRRLSTSVWSPFSARQSRRSSPMSLR